MLINSSSAVNERRTKFGIALKKLNYDVRCNPVQALLIIGEEGWGMKLEVVWAAAGGNEEERL